MAVVKEARAHINIKKLLESAAPRFNTLKVNGLTAQQAPKVSLLAAKPTEVDVSALFIPVSKIRKQQ
ncbi:hypothetical protein ACN079_05220 [Pseudomonas sp. ABY48]|uniref:hypothetical protein n=1 Tax=Pseudomonas sp. ABY48 TaxID=3402865 RepID=UPI003B43CC05